MTEQRMAGLQHKIYFAVLTAVVAVSLGACTTKIRQTNPQVAAQPDKVSAMLADAADRAASSLETLAAVEQSRTPAVAVAPIDDAPPELQRAITVNWIGPVEPITKQLADRAGYMFQTVGTPPPVPSIVSVDVENKPVIDVLRSIGLQLGARADVRVDGARKMVEIHYAPSLGQDG